MTEKLISKGLMLAISLILSCTTPLAYAQTSQPEKITVMVSKKPLENVLEKPPGNGNGARRPMRPP